MTNNNFNDSQDLIMLEHQKYMSMLNRNRTDETSNETKPAERVKGTFSMKVKKPSRSGRYDKENDFLRITHADIKTESVFSYIIRKFASYISELFKDSSRSNSTKPINNA